MNSLLRPSSPRGLSLLEALAALILLTLMAAALTPLIRSLDHPQTSPPPDPEDTAVLLELGRIADRFTNSPLEFGVAAEALVTPASPLPEMLTWPENPDRQPITLRRLLPDGQSAGASTRSHCWILFEYQDISVARCVPLQTDAGDIEP